jgi:RNA-directed DNA polymerase
MFSYTTAVMNTLIDRWEHIDWTKTQQTVLKWQQSIYTETSNGNMRKVRLVQKLLLNSFEARLLATRRVTQDNRGKATAGVDGVKRLTPPQRLALARELRFPNKASPLRRILIPKPGTTEKRPHYYYLGIPTIKDRCLQALMKLALEPEWEARFEPNSYGFRPGRNCHDAVKAVVDSIVKGAKYVLDADIAKCFDRIDHQALLTKIGLKGQLNLQLKYWLEAGVLDGDTFSETTEGTPQGGVISPLLANIALHGLESHLKQWISQKSIRNRTGNLVKPSRRSETLHVVRYADDFVVLHSDKRIILEAKEEVKKFLDDIGLELSTAKTR